MIFDYLIVAGGQSPPIPYIKKLLKICNNTVTVDGGAMVALKLKIRPLLHVGDDDSFRKNNLKKLRPKSTLTLSSKKNMSDLEFTLRYLNKSKTKMVIGAHADNEGRPDHGFLNLLLLSKMKNVFLVDEKNWITSLWPMVDFSFSPPKKTIFSVAALKKSKLCIKGSAYDLKGDQLKYQTQGLSNISQASRVSVKSKRPALLFVSSDITKTTIDDALLSR